MDRVNGHFSLFLISVHVLKCIIYERRLATSMQLCLTTSRVMAEMGRFYFLFLYFGHGTKQFVNADTERRRLVFPILARIECVLF